MRKVLQKINLPNILMFGAPGAGKGTYGTLLSKDLGFKNISTGDQIRDFLKQGVDCPEMLQIQKTIRSGGLIEDRMIMKIIQQNLSQAYDTNGFIFDGFPRTKSQAELFNSVIETENSFVINLLHCEEVLIEKLAGRRLCEDCGEGYNFANIDRDGYKMTPLYPNTPDHSCGECGGKLIMREDDDPKVIRDRLNIYRSETEPVLEIFDKMNIPILSFEAKRGKKDYPVLMELLKDQYLEDIDELYSEKIRAHSI